MFKFIVGTSVALPQLLNFVSSKILKKLLITCGARIIVFINPSVFYEPLQSVRFSRGDILCCQIKGADCMFSTRH